MCVYLRTKFQFSSIETGEENFTPEKNELLKSPPRLGLIQASSLFPKPYLFFQKLYYRHPRVCQILDMIYK